MVQTTARTYYYARVSSTEQNLSRQLEAFYNLGAKENEIIVDKASGKNLDRIGYQNLKVNLLRPGDTLIVKELDRLGRNKQQVLEELRWFRENNIRVKIMNIPTTMMDDDSGTAQIWIDMITNLLIEVLSTVAEDELKTRAKRQQEGIAAMPLDSKGRKVSLKTGRVGGRPEAEFPAGWDACMIRIKTGELTKTAAMNELGLKRTTFYKLLKRCADR